MNPRGGMVVLDCVEDHKFDPHSAEITSKVKLRRREGSVQTMYFSLLLIYE